MQRKADKERFSDDLLEKNQYIQSDCSCSHGNASARCTFISLDRVAVCNGDRRRRASNGRSSRIPAAE